MVKAKYADLAPNVKRPPPEKGWAEPNAIMQRQPGWTKKSNDEYLAELKAREKEQRKKGKNRGQKCDRCKMDQHELCWRVVCYCPCYKMKRETEEPDTYREWRKRHNV